MKKNIVYLFTLVTQLVFAQTIRIADNNANAPTGTNIYPTIQAAVDAAAANDIVYVQPSLTNYGNLTINKQVTLKGIGFNTGKDLAYSSALTTITLTNRSDGSSNASGTVIEGISSDFIYVGTLTGPAGPYTLENITISNTYCNRIFRGTGYQPVQNITIRNSITNIHFEVSNVNQILIYGNYLFGLSTIYYGYCGNTGFYFGPGYLSNCILSNNIIQQTGTNGINASPVSSFIVTNNNLLGGNDVPNSYFVRHLGIGGCYYPMGLYDALVSNNIFFGCTPASFASVAFERNAFSNNLSFGSNNNALPPAGTGAGNTGSNNIVNQDPLFVNAPYNTAFAYTMDFNLQPSSPAKNAGSDGTDVGITGGAYPVTNGNILLRPTSVPVMMSLNPAALVPQNQPVKTNIKAKSN